MADNFLWHEIKQTFRSGSMVSRLIVVNVIVFLALNIASLVFTLANSPYSISNDFIPDYLAVPTNLQSLLHRPWTLVTFSFTHFEFFHILFNMLWLYWIGMILTEFIGNKKILPIYIMGSVVGAALYILAFNVFPYFTEHFENSTAIGASAGVLAIVVAAATLLPDYTVMLFIWPVKLKWIAVVTVALDFISISKENPGGHISHIGGALFGFVFIKQLQAGHDWSRWMNNLFDWVVSIFSGKPRLKVSYSKGTKTNDAAQLKKQAQKTQERLDKILDKISQSGYDSLNKEEKEFLFKTSQEGK